MSWCSSLITAIKNVKPNGVNLFIPLYIVHSQKNLQRGLNETVISNDNKDADITGKNNSYNK